MNIICLTSATLVEPTEWECHCIKAAKESGCGQYTTVAEDGTSINTYDELMDAINDMLNGLDGEHAVVFYGMPSAEVGEAVGIIKA